MVRVFQPKIAYSKRISCNYQVKMINTKLRILEAQRGKKMRSQKELEALLYDPDQFDTVPVCPFGKPYTLDPKTGLVSYHDHGNAL